jgi:hypothetical protein
MVLYGWIMNKHEIKQQTKNRLYFDKFRYSICFPLKESTCLRVINANLELTHSKIDRDIELRKFYHRNWSDTVITKSVVDNLKTMASFLVLNDREYKLVVYSDWVYLYVNEDSFFEDLTNLGFVKKLWINEVVVTHPADTLLFKKNPYNYRAYFRSAYSKDPDVARLYNWLKNQPEVKLSPSLEHKAFSGFWEHHFVDFNDLKLPTMMALIRPDSLRKTYKICRSAD